MFVWKQLYQDKVLKQVFSQSHFLGLKRQNSKTEYQNVRFKSTSTPGEGLHLETAIWGLSKRDTLDIGEVRMPNGKVTSHVQNFGEDAMFVGSNGWTQVIGVADGVGGWIERGVDPSVFPLALMSACKAFVDSDHFTPNDAVALLAAGYSNVKNDKNNPVGKFKKVLPLFSKSM